MLGVINKKKDFSGKKENEKRNISSLSHGKICVFKSSETSFFGDIEPMSLCVK